MENLVLLAAVINRLVEVIKQALPTDNPTVEKWRSVLLLLLSFVLASAAMIFVFPDSNMFPGASSKLAGQIFSGILVGGAANGFNWLTGIIEQRSARPASVVSLKASVAAEETKAAA